MVEISDGAEMSRDEMLREILRKQEEALDLQGQLVLLNEKMDTLIGAVREKMTPQNVLSAIVSNPQSMLYLFIITIIALFLGLGDQVMDRVFGPSLISHSEILNAIDAPADGPGASVVP